MNTQLVILVLVGLVAAATPQLVIPKIDWNKMTYEMQCAAYMGVTLDKVTLAMGTEHGCSTRCMVHVNNPMTYNNAFGNLATNEGKSCFSDWSVNGDASGSKGVCVNGRCAF